MDKLEIKQSLFIAFFTVIILKIFEFVLDFTLGFGLNNFFGWIGPYYYQFMLISFLTAMATFIIVINPKLLNIKDKDVIKLFKFICIFASISFAVFLVKYLIVLFQIQNHL